MLFSPRDWLTYKLFYITHFCVPTQLHEKRRTEGLDWFAHASSYITLIGPTRAALYIHDCCDTARSINIGRPNNRGLSECGAVDSVQAAPQPY
jgi:hypothetical protein